MALLSVWERPGVWFSCTNLRLDVMCGAGGFSRMHGGGSRCCETHLTHSNSKQNPSLNQLEDKKPTEIQS